MYILFRLNTVSYRNISRCCVTLEYCIIFYETKIASLFTQPNIIQNTLDFFFFFFLKSQCHKYSLTSMLGLTIKYIIVVE